LLVHVRSYLLGTSKKSNCICQPSLLWSCIWREWGLWWRY